MLNYKIILFIYPKSVIETNDPQNKVELTVVLPKDEETNYDPRQHVYRKDMKEVGEGIYFPSPFLLFRFHVTARNQGWLRKYALLAT